VVLHIGPGMKPADPEGNPWSERKRLVWWDENKKKWTGEDEPDFIVDRPPSYRPTPDTGGKDTISGIDPFIMQPDSKGWIYAPALRSQRILVASGYAAHRG